MKNKSKGLIGMIVLAVMLSGCGTANVESNGGNNGTPSADVSEQVEHTNNEQPAQESANATVEGEDTNNEVDAGQADESEEQQPASSEDIHIIIDQTEKPIEGEKSSFDFVVKKRPEGYALTSMEWSSANHNVVNSVQEAIQHGSDGEDGFYISGNGQFMGFFYDKSLVGETGTVSFTFTNEQGDAISWSKDITLL